MKACRIIGAGDFFSEVFSYNKDDLIIAADGGYAHLAAINVTADLFVGDFDSLRERPNCRRIIELRRRKDDTDVLFAIKEGLRQDIKIFHIYGGVGGRVDHTIANIQALSYIAERGAQGFLYGQTYMTTIVRDSSVEFFNSNGGYASVFSYTPSSEGVVIKNLLYELDNARLDSSAPIGVSNEFIGKTARVSVADGALLIVCPSHTVFAGV